MTTLLAAIGAPLACGGTVESTEGPGPGGTGGGGSGGAPDTRPACTPIDDNGRWAGGFEECAEGYVHRPTVGECPGVGIDGLCMTDESCGSNSACRCENHTLYSYCIYAGCRTDADCVGGRCVLISGDNCSLAAQLRCVDAPKPGDTCAVDRDCGQASICIMSEDGTRSCRPAGCGGIGRPFLVAGAPRLPSIGTRSDWARCDAAPDVRALDAAQRAGLAAAWTEAARMEHASIAAFARFTLELLAFGAPASLVEQAQAATADETRHAQLCFALASAYAGRAIGPGPLSMTGVGVASSVAGSAFNAFVEGCIGETVAAAEAVEAASLATDPAIAAVLRAIAEDEARHAALAWRFVSWALGGMPGADRARAVSELATAVEAALAAPLPGTAAELDLAPHGILGSDRRAALRREVITTLVQPCLLALETGVTSTGRKTSIASSNASYA